MAINTTTFESTLQTKLNDTTLAAKEMLLLGKALESTVGSIAVSDINTAGANKVSEINTVASNTFKTVGGTSILGSGDIATLPSQSGASGKVLKSDGTNAAWGESGKVLQVIQDTNTSLVTASNNTRTEILSATITPSSTSSKILCQYHISSGSIGNEFLTYLQKGTTDIYKYTGTGITGTERKGTTINHDNGNSWGANNTSAFYLDSPNTTSSQTYSVEALQDISTMYVNRSSGTSSTDSQGGTSTLILMEIGA